MKVVMFLIVIALLGKTNTSAQDFKNINHKVALAGEVLVYKVKWTFLRLGTITIKTESVEGQPGYLKVSMTVESNPTLFFIDVKEYNESIIDLKNYRSVSFYADHKNGDERIKIFTRFDEKMNTAIIRMVDDVNQKEIKSDTIYNAERYVEGPSLFFLTRVLKKAGGTHNIPTMVEGEIANTKLVFSDEKEEFEVDAFDHPVTAEKYFGFAEWEGGSTQDMSGEFTGWITDDDASIPIYAELKILLGNLKLELEYCNRNQLVKNSKKDFLNTSNY